MSATQSASDHHCPPEPHSTAPATRSHRLGEDELIAACARELHTHSRVLLGSGDDCAVLAHPDQQSVISVDMLVEGHHFRRDWLTPYQIGARAAKQNLADIAAMGAAQHSAVISIAIPPTITDTELIELSRGLAETLEDAGSALVGGDLSAGEQLVLSVTIVGDLQGQKPLLRTGAQDADTVIFAGQLGYSPAGLELFTRGLSCDDLPAHLVPVAQRAIDAYCVPSPPLELGSCAAGKANSMIDVSDGLERDGGKIAAGSGKVVVLDPDIIAGYVDELRGLAEFLHTDPWTWVMQGGEDHGLLGTCPQDYVSQLVESGFTAVGYVRGPSANTDADEPFARPGLYLGSELCRGGGWDHFASA